MPDRGMNNRVEYVNPVSKFSFPRHRHQARQPEDALLYLSLIHISASDMETVSEAVRCGVFDYLIKPIAYERLGQTLTRFRQRKHMLESIDVYKRQRCRHRHRSAAPPCG